MAEPSRSRKLARLALRSQPVRLLLFPLVLAVAVVPMLPAQAQVRPSRTFDALASAYGFDSTIANASIPAGITIQGAGPVAQSRLTSLGSADGFASFPYPGDIVANISGLASAVFLAGFPVPSYPLIAQSNTASGTQTASFPGITLTAESAAARAHSIAVVGSEASGYTADSEVVINDDGTVTSTAETTFSGLQLGGVLTVDGLHSRATATLRADGTVEKEAVLEVGTIRVPALSLTIPTETPTQAALPIPIPGLPQLPVLEFPPVPIPLGGTTIVAPEIGFINGQFTISLPFLGGQSFAVPAQTVLDALSVAGITATYQAAVETEEGIVAPVLTLETVLPAPPENPGINGETTVRVALGRSSAQISGTIAGAPRPQPAPVAPSSNVGSVGSSGGSTAGGSLPSIGTGSSGGGAPVAAPSASTAAPAAPTSFLPASSIRVSIFDIYLVLVGVGLAGTAASQVIRYVGVRATWTS